MSTHRLAELRLGEEKEVVRAASPDEKRSDHAPFRCEDERLARLGGENVVREDPLEQVGGVRALHAYAGPRPDIGLGRDRLHRASVSRGVPVEGREEGA